MAKRGCLGVVRVAAAASGLATAAANLGDLSDWQFEMNSERLDASTMGSCAKSFVAGATETTGSFTVFWDGDNAVQTLLSPGGTVHFRVYPEGVGSGSNFYKTPSGGATVLTKSIAGNGVDGIVGGTVTWSVNGSLTATAVP